MNSEIVKLKKPRKRSAREKKQKSSLFYSRFDIAQLIGCTVKGVADLEKAGKLTPHKFGYRMLRYPVGEVMALIEKAKAN